MSGHARIERAPREAADFVKEIAEILAAGLTRLEGKKSSGKSPNIGESSLHFSPDQSGGRPIPENGEPQ
jgi:hypothetical protein